MLHAISKIPRIFNNKASSLGIYSFLTNRTNLSLKNLLSRKICLSSHSLSPNNPTLQLAPADLSITMASDKGRPLPKFGEWDVNNPASAEGFTVIFNKARDEKKTNTAAAATAKIVTPRKNNTIPEKKVETSKKKWFCCGA